MHLRYWQAFLPKYPYFKKKKKKTNKQKHTAQSGWCLKFILNIRLFDCDIQYEECGKAETVRLRAGKNRRVTHSKNDTERQSF